MSQGPVKFFILALICLAAVLIDRSVAKQPSTLPQLPPEREKAAEGELWANLTFERLLDAIAIVESGGDSSITGDNGNAVGLFQIWEIYVRDVNRILKEPRYTYADRYDPVKSREMVVIYLRHYTTERRLGRPPTLEDYSKIHNAGPNGYKKDCSKPYWEKVKKHLSIHPPL